MAIDNEHPDDYPRSLKHEDVRERKRAMLDQPHVLPLVEYANKLADMDRGGVRGGLVMPKHIVSYSTDGGLRPGALCSDCKAVGGS
jgi:hypothetical protein